MKFRKSRSLTIAGQSIAYGETRDLTLPISEMYTGVPISVPMRVIRGPRPGPIMFLTAAVHGDELNGIGIIRQLIFGNHLTLKRGALVCVPILNIFGFENYSRYMPDRRDLNRSFPGSRDGSLASRLAFTIMKEIVARCDCGIDLHSAADTRTNFPNVRADLRNKGAADLAQAFGSELIVNSKGPEGSLRRAACEADCPTIILEAGEVGKIEPAILEFGVRGVRNAMVKLEMIDGEIHEPAYQTTVHKSTWVRAELGGLLRFHVAPGDLVKAGDALATNESIFGDARSIICAPADAIVLGMATHPAVKPGEPVCHLAIPGRRLSSIRKALAAAPPDTVESRVRRELASRVAVTPLDQTTPVPRKKSRKNLPTDYQRDILDE